MEGIHKVLGKPLAELSDEELRARLTLLKQKRISKQESYKPKKATKEKKLSPEEYLLQELIALAQKEVSKNAV